MFLILMRLNRNPDKSYSTSFFNVLFICKNDFFVDQELIQAKWKEVERLESFWREAKLSEGCEGKRKKIGLQGVKTKALLRAILDDEAGAVFDAPMPSAGKCFPNSSQGIA
jgi:hypothetical protein